MPVDAFMDRRTVHRRPSRFEESQLQGVGQSVGQKPSGNKKAAEISGLVVILGGGTGIRTLDRLLTYAGFQDQRISLYFSKYNSNLECISITDTRLYSCVLALFPSQYCAFPLSDITDYPLLLLS
ncbi:Putative uncharacterized protein [Halomonas sp. R57-5]|nr:Putative uncharacterized protein [Halomonas sp. R57-5]